MTKGVEIVFRSEDGYICHSAEDAVKRSRRHRIRKKLIEKICPQPDSSMRCENTYMYSGWCEDCKGLDFFLANREELIKAYEKASAEEST